MKATVSQPYPTTSSRVPGNSAKFRAGLLAASSAMALGLGIPAAHAQTYTGAANDGNFNNAANWSGNAVPTATASFATATPTTITINGAVVDAFQFNVGASAYTFNITNPFEFQGLGIENNSNNVQTLVNSDNLLFINSSSAGNATIANTGAAFFQGNSSAGSATIINSLQVTFSGKSTGGTASFDNGNNANAIVDFSGSTGPGNNFRLSAGSIAGSGKIFLGHDQLTVGSTGKTTTFSGVINDGSATAPGGNTGGSIAITGGQLTLSNANLYTGLTMVSSGVLNVTGSINSPTTVIGGALAGSGTLGQTLVVNSGGMVAPGMVTPFSTLTVTGNATFATGSIFAVNINSTAQNDKLAIGGTATINGGTVQVLGVDRHHRHFDVHHPHRDRRSDRRGVHECDL